MGCHNTWQPFGVIMKTYKFVAASPIFYPYTDEERKVARTENYVSHYGFYKRVTLDASALIGAKICITAQNIYRLYINGEIVMQGPRRTAHGYLRVDEIDVEKYLSVGDNHIAVELVEYGDGYGDYSNDSTLEDAMLICELVCGRKCLFATGRDEMQVKRLDFRVGKTERISHSRESIEVYRLFSGYDSWLVGVAEFVYAAKVDVEKSYLYTSLLFPTLKKHVFENIISYGACSIDRDKNITLGFYESESYLSQLDDLAYVECRKTVETSSVGVKVKKDKNEIEVESESDSYIFMDLGKCIVGLLCLELESDSGIVDIVRSEAIDGGGNIPYYFGTVSRVHTSGGRVKRVFIEPGNYRYLKIYMRGCGRVSIKDISVLEYFYPDEKRCSFLCNDESVNGLYNAAKQTLLLNTLDIFMDCPERERAGWLCDSLWTARAASLMLSDDRVEREMLETFLLTDPKKFFYGFFPEAYPANKQDYHQLAGITTWSFWLMCELCEYVKRTGDIQLAREFEGRVAAFVDGSQYFIGKSGLLEDMPYIFVDWSMSNSKMSTLPISTAANSLYSYMLIELGELYENEEWISLGKSVRGTLRRIIELNRGESAVFSDSFRWDENQNIVARPICTEACIYTALWSGLFNKEEKPELMELVTHSMGTCPENPRDPDVLKSNLFIGLCIRLDMLSRIGEYEKMYKDLLDIYMWQIKEGPGTLWENNFTHTSSRCHGFASHAGVHLMRDIVGFADINKKEGKITIAPHICGLKWARGCVEIDGRLSLVEWSFDGHRFYMNVDLPENYENTIILPSEAQANDVKTEVFLNGKRL